MKGEHTVEWITRRTSGSVQSDGIFVLKNLEATETFVPSLVLSRFDYYCNALLSGIPWVLHDTIFKE